MWTADLEIGGPFGDHSHMVLVQTNLYTGFEAITCIFFAGTIGMFIGIGSLLASVGARPLLRPITLIVTLPFIGVALFVLLAVLTKKPPFAMGATTTAMLLTAITAFYWPEKPTRR